MASLSPNCRFYGGGMHTVGLHQVDDIDTDIHQIEINFGWGRSDAASNWSKNPNAFGMLFGLWQISACLTRSLAFTEISCTSGI
jgi:hypothetical protein